MRDRFIPFIESLVSEYGHTHERILCVSHGGLLLMMLPLVLCNLSHAAMAGHRFENTSCIVAELCPDGLVAVEWDGRLISEVPVEE
jgi:broad specificity phosphatase PhoE